MRISELITVLESLKRTHGDCEVLHDGSDGGPTELVVTLDSESNVVLCDEDTRRIYARLA